MQANKQQPEAVVSQRFRSLNAHFMKFILNQITLG